MMTRSVKGGAEILITVNGIQIQGLLHASIASTNCFSADSFSLTFALGSAPLSDIVFWSSTVRAYVEVSTAARMDMAAQMLITGMVDSILLDPALATVAIEGRDLSSSMIDSYRQQDFVNQTASEVVSAVARHHGLGCSVAPTAGNVGRYYGDGYTRLSLGRFSQLRSDWDLVVQLARENGFDVFVSGTTLYFQPSTDAKNAAVPIAMGAVQRMRIERSLSISSGTTARVQSWDSQNMTSYDSRREPADDAETASAANPDNQAFLFSSSNLTSQQVTDAAGRYNSELGRLATTLHLDMPWDLTLAPRMILFLQGTNSALDTTYRIDSIERRYNSKSGSVQSVRAAAI
jgi:hypothetical protein